MRPSSYLIRVNTLEEDQVLIIQGYTKAIDLVPRRVADLLDQPERELTTDDLSEQNLEVLARRGHVTPLTVEEERNQFVDFVRRLDGSRRGKSMPGFVLMPTYLCNLDCFYCYQKPAIESDADLVKHLMTPELADKAFEAYTRMLPEGRELKGGDILLYGGEPLLRRSRAVIEHVVSKARKNGMSVRAITNGTQLNHYADLLGPEGIGWMQITLDGPKESHDKRRVTRGGKGSFDDIVANIDLAIEKGASLAIRLNIDRRNLKSLLELDEFFTKRGWYAAPGVHVYASEVHMTEDQEEWVESEDLLSGTDLGTFITEHGLKIGSNKSASLGDFNKLQLANGLSAFKTAYCGANYSMCIFDSKGNVYSCWEEVEMFEPVGHYHTGTVVYDEKLRRAWQRSPLLANPRCHQCAYAFYCGGGCDWHGKKEGDAYYDRYCNAFMTNLRTAIAEDYAVSLVATQRSLGIPLGKEGKVVLTKRDREQILQEVSGKLRAKNISACQFSCSSQSIKDEAAIHQKKNGLIRLKTKMQALETEANTQLIGGRAC
jgi:uncharacterized protein